MRSAPSSSHSNARRWSHVCDTLAVVGPTGLLFGKNSDRPPHEPQVVTMFPRRPAGGSLRTQYLDLPDSGACSFMGSQPTWLWGVEHGLNEYGVAIGNEKVWTTGRPRDRAPALLGMDVVRLGLERSRTADEAVDTMTALIERYGQGGSGERDHVEPYDSSFLIADVTGGWIVETCDRTWAARPIGTGAAISNRLSLERNWTRASTDVAAGSDFQSWRHPKAPTTIADHRLAATTRCVIQGRAQLTPAALAAALRDHGSGPWGRPDSPDPTVAPIPSEPGADHRGVTVCMHVRGYQATTASMVASVSRDPRDGTRAWVALASPCASVYVPVFPGAGVPKPLSDPGVWSRCASLRDRAESDPSAAAPIRVALASAESELWETAAAIDGTDLRAQREYTAHAAGVIERVLRALSP